ncbi:small metal-binding protein SmbP [Methylomonas koyamae]|uniref:small metal-binding protein SmbP n=1 Tax=Methylomonas koyamae TaxID=702114 RepID=UPI00112AC40B|nr:small metal-binding protein SmbP [Methylomonas koyamae]TPQ26222.1 hypothetical protein C2U68_12340 [Methylomonas koyamae]
MNIIRTKLIGLSAGSVLIFCAVNAEAAESHMALSLEHAQTAAKTGDVKTVADHADAAKGHIKMVDEHLKAAVTSLDAAIAHGKQGHADLAKKSAEEAVAHLKAAQ